MQPNVPKQSDTSTCARWTAVSGTQPSSSFPPVCFLGGEDMLSAPSLMLAQHRMPRSRTHQTTASRGPRAYVIARSATEGAFAFDDRSREERRQLDRTTHRIRVAVAMDGIGEILKICGQIKLNLKPSTAYPRRRRKTHPSPLHAEAGRRGPPSHLQLSINFLLSLSRTSQSSRSHQPNQTTPSMACVISRNRRRSFCF